MSDIQKTTSGYPNFANEREEETYWAEQHKDIEARALKAFADGTVGRGRAVQQLEEIRARREAKRAGFAIELDADDVQKATQLAVKRGVEYQTLVRTLIHEALERELSVAG